MNVTYNSVRQTLYMHHVPFTTHPLVTLHRTSYVLVHQNHYDHIRAPHIHPTYQTYQVSKLPGNASTDHPPRHQQRHRPTLLHPSQSLPVQSSNIQGPLCHPGNPTLTETLKINNQPTSHHLRTHWRTPPPTNLIYDAMVGALCNNNGDTAERMSQMQLRGDI